MLKNINNPEKYMKKLNDITLVMPTKEEQESLPFVIKELKKFNIKKIIVIPKKENYEFIKDTKTTFLKQKKEGYGNALMLGIKKVNTNYFAIFNSDGSFKPTELETMLNKLKALNLDFIFGSRYKKNGRSDDDTILTLIGNYFFTKVCSFFFSTKITDVLYTYVVGKTESFKKLNIKSEDFSFCIELPIKVEIENMKYMCIASHERKRIGGFKKVNEFRDGIKIFLKLIYFFFKKY